MNIQENVSLAEHSTMRLGGKARYACVVTSKQELVESIKWAQQEDLKIIVIGEGSNIIWRDEGFDGLLIVNQLKGYSSEPQDNGSYHVTIAAGEPWDNVVRQTVNQGLTGIEALSLIPGTTGATPIQNVGAYGQDISQTLVSLEAYNLESHEFVTITNDQCSFGYRQSRFNRQDRGKFVITSITLKLSKDSPKPPFYNSVQQYLNERNITKPSSADVRKAVISIRTHKLPDPKLVANCGSFFGNPIVDKAAANALAAQYPDMPQMPTENAETIKIPAAWLIEKAGFKNYIDEETGMSTWPMQPLVLVNNSAKSTNSLIIFKQKIVEKVSAQFGIELKQEPELLP